MHTKERDLTKAKNTQLSDHISEGRLTTVMTNAKIRMESPEDYDARAEIMWAGSLAHNGLTGCGTIGDWATHNIEHELGGLFDVAHGAGLAAVWPSWARYVYKEDVTRFVQFAVNVMGIPNDFAYPDKKALAGIAAMEDFYQIVRAHV